MRTEYRGSIGFGILIIVLGVIWLLKNLGVFVDLNVGELISTYWPLLVVAGGVDLLSREVISCPSEKRSFRCYVNGLVLIIIGLFILGNNLEWYTVNMAIVGKVFWPLLIILIGWGMLRNTSGSGGMHWAVMSGIDLKQQGWKMEDGGFFALMGGVNMDASLAEIPEQTVTLNVTAIMGGIEIRVPPDLAVRCEGTAMLGGVTFFNEDAGGLISSRRVERPGAPGSPKKLIIRGLTIMGGIRVKTVR
jgi:hypothetical protein